MRSLIPQMGHDCRRNRRIQRRIRARGSLVLPVCHRHAYRVDMLNACAAAHIANSCPSGIDGLSATSGRKRARPHAEAGQFLSRWMYKSSAVQTAGPPRSKRRTEAKSRPLQALVKMLGRSIGMALVPCCWCRSARNFPYGTLLPPLSRTDGDHVSTAERRPSCPHGRPCTSASPDGPGS